MRLAADRFMRHYLVALQHGTRIPVGSALAGWAGSGPELLRASAVHFPGVGLLVGMAACVVFALVSIALPEAALSPLVAALACTIATVLLTGGFHEQGLSALADGLGAGGPRDGPLQTVNASRIGSFGAMAMVLALAAKVTLLALLASQTAAGVLAALLGAHVVSRLWSLLTVHTLPHVGDATHSNSKPVAETIDRRTLGLAAMWAVPPLALMGLAHSAGFALGALLLCGLGWLTVQRLLKRRLKGFTVDGLGATQQVCEIAFYLGAAIGLSTR